MFFNYLKVALRNLLRNKLYGTISIFGLAVGITGAALLYLYIDSELSYDTFHEKSDRIHRVVEISQNGDQTRYFGQTAPVLGSTLKETFPQVEELVRVYQPSGHVNMEWQGDRIHERSYLLADETFFEVFDFNIVNGDAATALEEPNSLVLSERKARQYFGEENPIGQVLSFVNLGEVTVTAVMENVPGNSHLQFDLLFSRRNSNIDWSNYMTSWQNYGAFTYLLLDESVDMASFQGELASFIEELEAVNENARNFYLQPISEIYFNSAGIEFGIATEQGDISYVWLFSAIGLFLLLIAGINYTNLATALSARRGREIGIRKVAGAERRQLVTQFLSESVVIALLACVLSALLAWLLLPSFNQLTGKSFELTADTFGYLSVLVLGIGLLLGLFSGCYPAFYLSLLQPIRTLKSKLDVKAGGVNLRKVLVVAQFSLSIILIIATLAVYKQMEYIRSADLGFEEEQTLVVDINHGNVRARFDAMKQEIERIPGVRDVAVSSRVPGEWKSIVQVFARNPQGASPDSVQSYFMSFDEDMLGLYGMELAAGSNFTGNPSSDSLTVILNQAAASALGLEDPVGRYLDISGSGEPMRVVGVTGNFHYQSLHQRVAPLIIGYRTNPISSIDYFSIRMGDRDMDATIADIKQVHAQFDPSTAMEYHFLDQQIGQKYLAEQRAGRLFAAGGSVTILIACLGLFGLALFTIESRMKEVGIRKVLGATVPQILALLTTDFLKLVGIAFVVAVPVSFFVMDGWLQNFAYRTELGVGIFLLAGAATLLISVLTISYQTVRAALADPVRSLRSE